MLHSVGFASPFEIIKNLDFVLIHRKNQRSIPLVAKAQFFVELGEHLIARPAKFGVKRARLIIVATVDDALHVCIEIK